MKLILAGLLLMGITLPGICGESDAQVKQKPLYKWTSTIWLNFDYPPPFALSIQLKTPQALQEHSTSLHVRFGMTDSEKDYTAHSNILNSYRHRNEYEIYHLGLDLHKPLWQSKYLNLTLLSELGLAYIPYHSYSGKGLFLSGGIKVQQSRWLGEIRYVYDSHTENHFRSFKVGYQSQTVWGAMVGPTGYFTTLTLLFLFIGSQIN